MAAEVAGLQAELPTMLRGAASDIQAGLLDAAMRYYADFLAYAHSGAGAGSGPDPSIKANPSLEELPADLLPALQEVRRADLGDPAGDAAAALGFGAGSAAGGGDTPAPNIDWDLGAGEEDSAATAINWNAPSGAANTDADGGGGEDVAESAPAAVDWDIDVGAAASADGAPAGVVCDVGDGGGGGEGSGVGDSAGEVGGGPPADADWGIEARSQIPWRLKTVVHHHAWASYACACADADVAPWRVRWAAAARVRAWWRDW